MEFISIKDLHRRWKEGLEVRPAKLPFLDFPPETCPFVEGFSHVVAGKPKVGKTELMLQVVMGWTDKRVTWFTEEPRVAWVERVALMDEFFESSPGNFMLVTGCRAAEPNALLEEVRRNGGDVVIMDTVKLLRIRDENDNAGITRALTPWTAWAEESHTTLIFMHHNRNAEGTYGDQVAGGHAWVANVDLFLTIRRKSGKEDDTRRVVEGIGRVFENKPFMYTFNQETREITVLGSPDVNNIEEVKRKVLEVVEGVVDVARGLTTAEVRNELPQPQPSKRQVLSALTELAEAGTILRVPPIEEEAERRKLVWRMGTKGK